MLIWNDIKKKLGTLLFRKKIRIPFAFSVLMLHPTYFGVIIMSSKEDYGSVSKLFSPVRVSSK